MTIDVCSFVIRIDPEPENDKPTYMAAFNEIVTGPVDSVHIERLSDDLYWMLIMKDGIGQRIVIGSASGKSKVVARTEID